jgi:hypothetical protein
MNEMKIGFRIRAATVAALSLALSACFTMNHSFPPNTQFGRRPEGSVGVRSVGDKGMKNYLLSGLVPYTSFGTKDLAKDPGPGKRLADVEIETQFNWFDFVVSIVPGLYYGYYVWAPRHVGYKAVVVENHSDVVAATH